jgi:CBS domain-containing protein
MPTVRDLMHRGLITCPASATLGEVAALLVRERIHAVVVTDEADQAVGVVSDTDLLSGEWLATDVESLRTMTSITTDDLKSEPLATVDVDADAGEAAARMRKEHVSRLVVLEGEEPVGVITVSDLVAGLASVSTERAKVADVMSRAIVTALADTPVSAVARGMTERRSRSVVIVDRQGHPVGVVTGFDLLALIEAGGGGDLTAEAVMNPPLTIAPDASLQEAADAMLEAEVHRLLVVEPEGDGMPLGLISTSDIVAQMAEPGSVWAARPDDEES